MVFRDCKKDGGRDSNRPAESNRPISLCLSQQFRVAVFPMPSSAENTRRCLVDMFKHFLLVCRKLDL